MASSLASLSASIPPIGDFFPPTPQAQHLLYGAFKYFPLWCLFLWTPLSKQQAMGRTSVNSILNLPGRYAWCVAESIGPINLIFILYTLPSYLHPRPATSSSFLFTGLPAQNEILALMYVAHYLNRAFVTPLFYAPSMSPIHVIVACLMATFQFINSSNIASWLVNSTLEQDANVTVYPPVVFAGVLLFVLGLVGNITAEHTLFSLRIGAAQRKARSEGKAVVTYDKVYVIPPAEGLFKYILYPHYTLEWLEWLGYWVFGGAVGLGWDTPALWFVLAEVSSMLPRAVDGRKWYAGKFGERKVEGGGCIACEVAVRMALRASRVQIMQLEEAAKDEEMSSCMIMVKRGFASATKAAKEAFF